MEIKKILLKVTKHSKHILVIFTIQKEINLFLCFKGINFLLLIEKILTVKDKIGITVFFFSSINSLRIFRT